MTVRSDHGVWQFAEYRTNPPAFNPRGAAGRVPIEHYCKPVKHELDWAGFRTPDAEAIICHWNTIMFTFTFSLLHEGPLPGWVRLASPLTRVAHPRRLHSPT